MSIASRITSIEGHISDIYDSVELTGVDTTDIDKNLVNVPNTLKEGYIDILNNGTDTLYNNFPKVSGEGTSLTLNNTYQAPMRNNLKGNTSQTGTPTPTSPIPVNVVSGNNEIFINNANLWCSEWEQGTINSSGDNDTSSSCIRTKDYIPVIPNQNYAISRSISGSYINARCYDSNKNYLGSGGSYINLIAGGTASNPMSAIMTTCIISPKENVCYLRFNDFTNNLATQYMMVKGDTIPTDYVPYEIDTYNIDLPSGMELCKIGNYQDYFYKDSDKWYLHKEIGKVVLNGSENWQYYNGIQYITSISDYKLSGLICLCSHYIAQQNVSISGDMIDKHIAFRNTVNNPNLYIKDSTYTDSTTFKTWLTTHNTSVYYILATPTNTEITDTTLINQLEELYIAKSKENQTNISQINNDLGFIISASALKKG